MQHFSIHRHIHLIVNPAAARGKARLLLPIIERELHELSFPYSVLETRYPGEATTLVRAIGETGHTVIAMGGDGTVNEVLNGIVGTGHLFGVIPAGRGNDFARLLGISGYRAAMDALRTGNNRECDVGEISLTDCDGAKIHHYYINTMGIGFDALVALRVLRSGMGTGVIPYLAAVLRTLARYNAVPTLIRFPGGELKEKLFLASFGNGTTSGGGFILSPRAEPDDGLLDLCLVKEIAKSRVLRVLPKTFRGNHIKEREVIYTRSPAFSLETAFPLPVHADGEILTDKALRLDVVISPHTVRVLSRPSLAQSPDK